MCIRTYICIFVCDKKAWLLPCGQLVHVRCLHVFFLRSRRIYDTRSNTTQSVKVTGSKSITVPRTRPLLTESALKPCRCNAFGNELPSQCYPRGIHRTLSWSGAGPVEYLLSRSVRYKLYNIISLFAFTAVTARPILGIDFPQNWITLQYVVGNFMIHLFLNVIMDSVRNRE